MKLTHEADMKEIDMSKLKTPYALPVALILAGALAGCATNRKCESGGCSGDAKITTNVHALLDQHPDLGPPNLITVQTMDRVVYLSGEVSAGEFSASAESVAHEVPGVVRVVNSIAISR
jgi:osmotically-inducible protein OsmY